jgi:uncharacterized protein (DUF486 family)
MLTAGLLLVSNVFMTFAWYFHLKHQGWSLGKAILISWGIAWFEYLLMVPANRSGYQGGLTGFQLKVLQEVITLLVFSVFAVLYLKEPLQWKHGIAALLLVAAVVVVFRD